MMRITEKGQVTIPQKFREKMGFLPHTEIDFLEKNGELVIRKVPSQANVKGKKSRGWQLVEHLTGTADIPITTEEIMEMTRGVKL